VDSLPTNHSLRPSLKAFQSMRRMKLRLQYFFHAQLVVLSICLPDSHLWLPKFSSHLFFRNPGSQWLQEESRELSWRSKTYPLTSFRIQILIIFAIFTQSDSSGRIPYFRDFSFSEVPSASDVRAYRPFKTRAFFVCFSYVVIHVRPPQILDGNSWK